MFSMAMQQLRVRKGQADPTGSTPEAVLTTLAQMELGQVFTQLEASSDGLTGLEAASRLKAGGPNVVSSKKPPSWWLLLLMVIPNPFNLLLGFIAIISVASPDRSWVSSITFPGPCAYQC